MKLNSVFGSLVLCASMCSFSYAGLLDRMLGIGNTGCDTACCDTVIADPTCGCELVTGCATGCNTGCEPTCGVELIGGCNNGCDPTCGVEFMGGCNNGCDPTCGVEINACGNGCCEPSCGVEVVSCQPRSRPVLGLLKRIRLGARRTADRLTSFGDSCCDSGCDLGCNTGCYVEPTCGCEMGGCGIIADPTCGCEMNVCDPCGNACDSFGVVRRGGLLGKLFQRRSSSCCDAMIGCDSGCAAPAAPCGCGGAAMPAAPAAPAPAMEAAPAAPAPVVDPSAYLQSKRRVIQASTILN